MEWMELAQERLQWKALVLVVLNLRTLLPYDSFHIKYFLELKDPICVKMLCAV
jgi:hypothetical protein